MAGNGAGRHGVGVGAGREGGGGGGGMARTAGGCEGGRGVAREIHEANRRLWRYPDQRRVITAFSGGTGRKQTRWGMGDIEASLGLDFGSFHIQQFDTPT